MMSGSCRQRYDVGDGVVVHVGASRLSALGNRQSRCMVDGVSVQSSESGGGRWRVGAIVIIIISRRRWRRHLSIKNNTYCMGSLAGIIAIWHMFHFATLGEQALSRRAT